MSPCFFLMQRKQLQVSWQMCPSLVRFVSLLSICCLGGWN